MHNILRIGIFGMSIIAGSTLLALSPDTANAEIGKDRSDLSKEKILYCVPYAHLDTQWRWDYTTTIDKFIRATLDDNFARLEKFPDYQFTFTGSIRYEMMKEYYPDKFQKLKDYVKEGRWHVGGSSVEEGDVNVPSPESVIRQVLYGNQWFRKELGKESVDFMLPDCFGFQASMPSIWAHCGLRGFSTQKLTWGSAVGIPFPVGVWQGPDGKGVICAFDPGEYIGGVKSRLDINPRWVNRVNENGKKYGVFADYHYFGTGDMGGAPREEDIDMASKSLNNPDSQVKVRMTSSDQMFRDITDEQAERLPRYKGDLLLTEHSAGSITSQAYMKRWNRKNEQLADSAERAAVAADWLGAQKYPLGRLNNAWSRVLGSQFHDILPGTSIPKAYEYAWNDEILAMNIFSQVMQSSVGSVIQSMDTEVKGIPVVVYNPLAIKRKDVVEGTVEFPEGAPEHVAVFDAAGKEVPCQILDHKGKSVRLIFLGEVKPVSFTVFDVRSAKSDAKSSLKVTDSALENSYYRVTIDRNGDVSSIIDKKSGNKELLAAPAQLQFLYENPTEYPAWNMDWTDRQKSPIGVVDGPARIRIVENGPVRVSLEITREARNSIFTQQIRLTSGSKRIEFKTHIDWQSTDCCLKAAFPLTVSNPKATYNLGLGTIERGNNDPKKYEVPSREWFDLTDKNGEYGVSVLEDCKFGSDKPNNSTVRLTLLHTPHIRKGFEDEYSQDWGLHDITYALYGHERDWRAGGSEWQGRRVNQPLVGFQTSEHSGKLGHELSLMTVSNPAVDVRAFKKAEDSDHYIVRLQELHGKSAENVTVKFASPVVEAYEVNGQERKIGEAKIVNGKLSIDFGPYSPRSFAVKLAAPSAKSAPKVMKPLALEFNADVISNDSDRNSGGFDSEGRTIPAEMLPQTINCEDIIFNLGKGEDGSKNAVACEGQTIALPKGDFNHIYILAAATEKTVADFEVDGVPHKLTIPSWTGFIGQYDNRLWDKEFGAIDYECKGKVTEIVPGYIQRDPVAWFCTHRHHPKKGNESYQFSYLYIKKLNIKPGSKSLTLPKNANIKILAITAANNPADDISPVQPLYDDFSGRGLIKLRVASQ